MFLRLPTRLLSQTRSRNPCRSSGLFGNAAWRNSTMAPTTAPQLNGPLNSELPGCLQTAGPLETRCGFTLPKAASLPRRSGMSQPRPAPATPGQSLGKPLGQVLKRPGYGREEPVRVVKRWGTSPDGTINVTSVQDGGNIEVVSVQSADNIQLRIIPDPWCATDNRSHFQWFSFQASGVQGKPLSMAIVNAGQASYTGGWENYQTCASYNLEDWFRVPTDWDANTGALTIHHTPEADSVQYAYFAPYSMTRHEQLIHRTQLCKRVKLKVLGHTLDGRPMQMLQIGEMAEGKRKIWVIARQHPGETMAEYFMEGLLARLTDSSDATTRALLNKAVFFCIPNMCPDGSARGHLRTNACGFNLNRAWASPDPSIAPEVYATLKEMDATGLDFLMDVHGDEALPYNFVAGNDGIPAFDDRLKGLQDNFKAAYSRHSPDFQGTHGYATDQPGQANLVLCSKQIGQRFNALSLTLEMPFKDNVEMPDPQTGWSPQRSMRLGAAVLGAINDVVAVLR